jgi:hypothetical protein
MSGTPLLDETSQPPEDWEGHCDLVSITRQPSRWERREGLPPSRRAGAGATAAFARIVCWTLTRPLLAVWCRRASLLEGAFWLGTPVLVGLVLGLLLPTSDSLPPPVDRLSSVIGWVSCPHGQQERAGRRDGCPSGAVFATLRCLLASQLQFQSCNCE